MEEENKALRKLRLERTQLRRLFTMSAKKVDDSLQVGNKDELFIHFAEFADKAERLFKVEEKINDLIFSVVTDEQELAKEIDETEGYRERWVALVAKRDMSMMAKNDHDGVDDRRSSMTSTNDMKKRFKFPKLELRKFDGDIRNWLKFWSFFKKLDEDKDIDDDEKFEYLIQCTEEGSKARALVESFPATGENYRQALEHLKRRFGRDELLIEIYVRELLGMVLSRSAGRAIDLRVLYDQIETRLRALQGLGVANEKYAYMLLPMVESALPEDVFTSWERSRPESDDGLGAASKKLEELLIFLRKEVERVERRALTQEMFSNMELTGKSNPDLGTGQSYAVNSDTKPIPTAADLVSMEGRNKKGNCVFCNKGSHESDTCFTAMSMALPDIEQALMKKGCCFNCMKPNHRRSECRATVKCVICHGRHLPLLCRERKANVTATGKSGPDAKAAVTLEQNLSNISCLPNVLMQTLLVVLRGRSEVKARLLIDTGSQRSYVSKRMMDKLGCNPLREEQLIHALFGGAKSAPTVHKCFKVSLRSMDGAYACNFEALETEVICQVVPTAARGPWLRELKQKGIVLSDVEDGPIDILVGADIAGKLLTGRVEVLASGLVAVHTLLGWTLMGKVDVAVTGKTCDTYLAMVCADMSPADLWKLDVLGIEDPTERLSKEQQLLQTMEHFYDTVRILDTGRYQVQLPWRKDHPPLSRNYELALTRLEHCQRQLRNTGMGKVYAAVLTEWLDEGIIEEVDSDEWDAGHYLPHRPVYKLGSTTPVRPVFNASARERGQPSLNQCLETGPNLIEQIPSILMRFRYGKIGIIADIKKAFLQISVSPTDRDYLRFIWREEDGRLRIFRHARVVFGVSASPYLLGAVLRHHLDQCQQRIDKGEISISSSTVEKLRNCMYVDNFVGSLSDETEVEPFISSARCLFSMASFDLRGWEKTDPDLSEHSDVQVLGLIWDPKSDVLKIRIPDYSDVGSAPITKRTLLSIFQRLFDPIGLVSPVMILPKRIFQKVCAEGGGWDVEVDKQYRDEIVKWTSQVQVLSEIQIPRWLGDSGAAGAKITLHTFCDASLVAYAAAVYVRTEFQDHVSVRLVASKSRIAPLEKMTIPRLELIAATVGARLSYQNLKALGVSATYYWTDSSTVLTWIQKEEPWAMFVGNRVNEIRKLSDKGNWRHISGSLNPADLASRGCSPSTLMKQRWWEGPSWLQLPESEWPQSSVEVSLDEVMAERKKTVVTSVTLPVSIINSALLTRRFGEYHRIVNVVAWMLRFLFNKYSKTLKFSGPLSVVELNRSEKIILRIIQEEAFSGKTDPILKKLKPQTDKEGLIRLRTKIWARKDAEDFRAPFILPSNHVLVDKLILHVHRKNGHAVSQGLLTILRERYWIVRGRQTIRRALKSCVTCQRVAARALDAETPPLPEDRVRDARVFEVCGTDLAGPLYLRNGDKVWICIFTCAVYRALYLDLVTSLSTESFMLVFRRFVARHGRPSLMYSDNGTNFHGLSNALNNIDWEKIRETCAIDRIEWRFNPPTAAWWGGFWERLIGLVKTVLRKLLGRASLTMEELTTVVCETAAFVNSRPITFVSEDPTDPVAVTPQMFISDVQETGLPDFNEIDQTNFDQRVRRRVATMTSLKCRFRTEYLGQLNQAAEKWRNHRIPKIGELVMVESSKKRNEWPLAIVEEVIPGKDGVCRVVRVRTAEGPLTRPIQRIFPLEVPLGNVGCSEDGARTGDGTTSEDESSNEDEDPETAELPGDLPRLSEDIVPSKRDQRQLSMQPPASCDVTTRCGRRVVLPARFWQ